MRIASGLGLLGGFAVGGGCWGLAENHCGNLDGVDGTADYVGADLP